MSAKAWNAAACYVDGRKYESIFSAAVDFEIDYSWLFVKLKKSGGAPVSIRGHTIALANWIEKKQKENIPNVPPETISGKEKNR